MFTLIIANLISGITCLILGLIIQTGKASFLIAGLNTMSATNKVRYNVHAISKFTGWVILVVPSVILLIACIPILLNFFPTFMLILSWALFMVFVCGGAIYVNLSPRFKHSE